MKKLLPENLLLLFVTCLMLQPVTSVMAENSAIAEKVNWYTVEVVSFTRAKTAQVQEKWLPAPQLVNSYEMTAIEPAPASEKQLGRHAYAINQAPGLSVKSHQIWRQKGLPREVAPWINLATDSPTLNGKVRISLSRYLHADIDIQLKNPDWSPSFSYDSTASGQGIPEIISFNDSRKLKRGKIHYIDHPLAGVLLHIERFEKEQAPAVKQEADSQIPESANDKTTT